MAIAWKQLICVVLCLQYLGCQSKGCPRYRKNVQWMNGEKGLKGNYTKSAEECQMWCQRFQDYYNPCPYQPNIGGCISFPCVGWSFWADSGPWSKSSWCYLFANKSEPLENTGHPSSGAISGLAWDCGIGKGPTVAEYLLEGVDALNRKHWRNFLPDDTDIDQDGNISDNEVEHKFQSYMGELFKMMDQDKDNIVAKEELQSLRIDLPGLYKFIDVAMEIWPLKSILLAADGNKDGFYDESDFYTPEMPRKEPLGPQKDIIETSVKLTDNKIRVSFLGNDNGYIMEAPKDRGWVTINGYTQVCEIGENEGHVICMSLGFEGLKEIYQYNGSNEYGQAGDKWSNRKFICDGTERQLEYCQRTACGSQSWQAMAVICNRTIGSLHLVGGKGPSSGDIFLGNEGLGCSPHWSDESHEKQSEVICRELGFPGFVKTTGMSTFTNKIEPRPAVLPIRFKCNGNEERLTECQQEYVYCDKDSVQGIICRTDSEKNTVVDEHLERMVNWNPNIKIWEMFGRFLFIADTNNDEKLSLEEISAKTKLYMATIFQLVDQTGDENISLEDFTFLNMTVGPIHKMIDMFIYQNKNDRMKDAEIDLSELIFMGRDLRHYIPSIRALQPNYDFNNILTAEYFYNSHGQIHEMSEYLIPSLSQKLDKNQDGKIQRQELRLFIDGVFKKIDADQSGAFTFEDIYSLMRNFGYSCLQVLQVQSYISLVTNVTEANFRYLMTLLFMELDFDKNGEIALKELQQMQIPCEVSGRGVQRLSCDDLSSFILAEPYGLFFNQFPILDANKTGDHLANVACQLMP